MFLACGCPVFNVLKTVPFPLCVALSLFPKTPDCVHTGLFLGLCPVPSPRLHILWLVPGSPSHPCFQQILELRQLPDFVQCRLLIVALLPLHIIFGVSSPTVAK